jgi:hypothetical protein
MNTNIKFYNSALEKHHKHPIIHTQSALFMPLNILFQKLAPKTPPNYALTLSNSTCQENSCKMAYQGKKMKNLKPSKKNLLSSNLILGFE